MWEPVTNIGNNRGLLKKRPVPVRDEWVTWGKTLENIVISLVFLFRSLLET